MPVFLTTKGRDMSTPQIDAAIAGHEESVELARKFGAAIAQSDERITYSGTICFSPKELSEMIGAMHKAARLCADRGWMVSGSLEMAECDEFCKSVGLDPWTWKHRFERVA